MILNKIQFRQRYPTILFVSFVVLVFEFFGYPYRVTFSSDFLSRVAAAFIGFTLPFLIIYGASYYKSWLLKTLFIVTFVLTGILSGLFGLISTLQAIAIYKDGVDESFKLIDEVPLNGAFYRLYLTDCGATCAVGLSLQKEWLTPVGIKFTKTVWYDDRGGGEGVKLKLLEGSMVSVEGYTWVKD